MEWYDKLIIVLCAIIIWLMLSTVLYKQFFKRFYDIVFSGLALIVFSWLYLIIAILVRCKLGKPIIFTQIRPGKKDKHGREKLFKLYKFRTMTDERDENGELLPDEKRMTKFGKWLRDTSLDEIPEAWNILKGDMSIIGPRPQLVKDMVFMTEEQRTRHNVKPGLSGLAQVSGRNAISWDNKLSVDLQYIKKITFYTDIKIIFKTVQCVLCADNETPNGTTTAEDYGDYLLHKKAVSEEEYTKKQHEAQALLLGK